MQNGRSQHLKESIGWNLKRLLKQKGISSKVAAEAIGVHPNHMSRIFNGTTALTNSNAATLAELCGVSVAALMLEPGASGVKSTPQSAPEAEAAALAVQVVRERPDKTERLLGLLRGLLLGAAICAVPVASYGKPMARCTPENYPDSLHNLSKRKKRAKKAA